MSTTRYGESRAAYREVQERHEDIRKIEHTLVELAQMFNDVRTLPTLLCLAAPLTRMLLAAQ